MRTLTFSYQGKRRVERVPRDWGAEVEKAVLETQHFADAVRELMSINLELLAVTRSEERSKEVRRKQPRSISGKKRSTFRGSVRSIDHVSPNPS
jgi:chloramphenicol 3-O-phosphotransferase